MIDPTACQRTRMSPRALRSPAGMRPSWTQLIVPAMRWGITEPECVNRWVGFGRRSPIELFQLGFFFFLSVDQCAEDII